MGKKQFMLDDLFQRMSEENKGEFKKREENVRGRGFSRMPITHYQLSFLHHNSDVKMYYEFGNHNIAEIEFTVDLLIRGPEIQIETNDNILRLLRIKKQPWKVKCKDKTFAETVVSFLEKSGLTEFANETVFEPTISGKWELGKYLMKTNYSLAFENKEYSIEPMVNFHKMIINHLNEKYGG